MRNVKFATLTADKRTGQRRLRDGRPTNMGSAVPGAQRLGNLLTIESWANRSGGCRNLESCRICWWP
jgi:hypothetical protein